MELTHEELAKLALLVGNAIGNLPQERANHRNRAWCHGPGSLRPADRRCSGELDRLSGRTDSVTLSRLGPYQHAWVPEFADRIFLRRKSILIISAPSSGPPGGSSTISANG